MQLLSLTLYQTILSVIFVCPIMILLATMAGRCIPQRAIDRWRIFRPFPFESERFYRDFIHINKWKHLLPDGAALRKNGFSKKHMAQTDPAYLKRFISETKRAELIHLFSIIPLWVFGFWMKPIWVLYLLLFSTLINLPCILAQRYNRPRLEHLLALAEERNTYDEHIQNRTETKIISAAHTCMNHE